MKIDFVGNEYYLEEYIDSDGQILTIEIDEYKTKYYFNSKNQLHRLDGPAVVNEIYSFYDWYKNGKLHRIGGQARKRPYKNYYTNIRYIDGRKVETYYIYG